jgi:hypothetical protein
MFGLVEVIVLIAAVGGSGWLVGMLAWLWFRVKRLEEQPDALGRLRHELESQESELNELRREIASMSERMAFSERLLEGGRAEPGREQDS